MNGDRNVFEAIITAQERAGEENFRPHGPPQATMAIPGSEEKIAVLAARVEAGLEMWHEDDGPGLSVA